MLLRTSSNPISPALLSTAIDSATKRDLLGNAATAAAYSASTSPSATSSRRQISCSKSPLNSPKFNNKKGDFRRALSDSNLEDLASPGGLSSNLSSSSPQFQKLQEGPRNGKKLESAPSFGIYHSGDGFEPDEEERKDSEEEEEIDFDRTGSVGEMIEPIEGDFSFEKTDMGLIVEEEEGEENEEEGFDPSASPPMYLATGLGAGFVGGVGSFGVSFEEEEDAEAYYKKMIDEYPNHPLLLRNYAEMLKAKGSLEEASDYYLRATLADPQDGELLAQYAKLVWVVHHDEERASEYFERAVQASSQDCHVLAAWASFLWETASESVESQNSVQPVQTTKAQSKSEADSGTSKKEGPHVEEHLKQLVEQNPSNAMLLRNYAHFLYEKKGDLKGAEEHYSRAILADPRDGEILAQYANLVWEAHKDEVKARTYFERAVQVAPSDSHVLASYASFLWATDGDEEEQKDEAILVPSVRMPSCVPRVAALRG